MPEIVYPTLSWLYDACRSLYSEIPYRFSPSGKAFPAWHFFLEITRRCNLRCKMCQYITFLENIPLDKQKEGELTTEEWVRVIDQISRFSLITFTGGEPLIRRDFPQLLEHASKKSRTHIITNATLINESFAELCVQLAPRKAGGVGLNFLGVSIEGPPNVHNAIRRQPFAFEKATQGLSRIQEYREKLNKKLPLIHITTVIQSENVSTLHSMPRIAAELGANVLNLVTETRIHDLVSLGDNSHATYASNDIQWPRIDKDQLRSALEETEEAATQSRIQLRLPRMPREELLNYYSSSIDLTKYHCRSPWSTIIVGRNGDVYPCWLRNVGNVREHSLRILWNSTVMRDFRKACQKGLFPLCPGCCFMEYSPKNNRR